MKIYEIEVDSQFSEKEYVVKSPKIYRKPIVLNLQIVTTKKLILNYLKQERKLRLPVI